MVRYRAVALLLILVGLTGPPVIVFARSSAWTPANMTIAQDRSRSAAEQAAQEGRKLRAQNTPESLKGAIAKFEEALTLLGNAEDPRAQADLLNSIGQVYFSLSEMRQSLEYHNRALSLTRTARDRQRESDTLKAMGVVYRVLGENYKSLDYYNQALALARAVNDQGREMWLLSAMGLAYYVLGENQKALDAYRESLVIAREKGQQFAEQNVLSHMGSVYNVMGEKQKALDSLNKSLEMSRIRGDGLGEAGALQSIGRVHHSMGDYQKALDFLNQSLPLGIAARSRASQARAHYNIGKAYVELGQHEQARDHLNEALEFYKSVADQSNLAATVHVIARLERSRGNLIEALAEIDGALNMIEWMRARAVTHELRAAYLASVRKYYELKIDVLLRLDRLEPSKNHAAAAFQVSELARARSLLETLIEAGTDIREGVSPDLIQRERAIQQQLSAKAADQMRILSTDSSKDQLSSIERQIEELSARYQEIQAEIRAASPRYAALMQPHPLSLADIQQQILDPQTVLLEYYLGEERSYLWAVTPDSIKSYELPKGEEIQKAASRVYELLTERNRRAKFETVEERRIRIEKADAQYADAASALTQMILGPVALQIAGKRLLIVSDGALQYVPFGALPAPPSSSDSALSSAPQASSTKPRTGGKGPVSNDSYTPLAIDHEIVVLPSAQTLAVLRREIAGRKPAPKAIAVLADPVFDKGDERVRTALAQRKAGQPVSSDQSRSGAASFASDMERSAKESGWGDGGLRISRLPFTRKEAQVIAELVPASGRKEALDFEASRASLGSLELSQYRVVHFATHGFLNSVHPELSGVVLSLVDNQGREQDGFLRANEIYNLKLPAELVVLSGCRTGLGKEIKGEGLVGLTRAFMYAGAARVMVSLWDINDKATAEFMTRFYRASLGKEQMRPAAALRAAQISMWKEKRWPSPYYWAAFVLQGESR